MLGYALLSIFDNSTQTKHTLRASNACVSTSRPMSPLLAVARIMTLRNILKNYYSKIFFI